MEDQLVVNKQKILSFYFFRKKNCLQTATKAELLRSQQLKQNNSVLRIEIIYRENIKNRIYLSINPLFFHGE